MAGVSGISTVSKIFTKLGDNTGSVVPMYVKDFSSTALTSVTYFKDGGGKTDGAEKALEGFGTGVLWLGGIPFIKKTLFDNLIYKKAKINPDVDAKRLFANSGTDTVEYAKNKAESLGEAFAEQKEILEDTIKNKKLAKKLSLGKFAFSTALTGLALVGLINLKQKKTEKKLEKEIRNKIQKENYSKDIIENTDVYNIFKGNFEKKQNEKGPTFKGLGSIGTFFMTNPVANTSIVDGIITGVRLKQGRKGEKAEIGLNELGQILFIYGFAPLLQKGLEGVSKMFNKPIALDYSVLDSKTVKRAITSEKTKQGSSALLKQAKELVKISENSGEDVSNKIIDFVFDSKNKDLAEIFKKTGDVGVFKTKENKEQLSPLSGISTDKLKKTAKKTIDLIETGAKNNNPESFLKKLKFIKGTAIIGNIAVSVLAMGYLLPKLSIALRKKINGGEDKTNPAILELEKQIRDKIALEENQKNEP